MKNKYVAPESKLIALNFKESIAASESGDIVSGMAVIKFHAAKDACRETYTKRIPVTQSVGPDFVDYYSDFMALVQSTNNFEAYFYCFNGMQDV